MRTNATLLLALLTITGIVHSQTVPDAGALQQQIEKQRDATLPLPSLPEVAPVTQPIKSTAGVSLTISHFMFTGNTLISDSELEPVVASYLNRPVTFADLQQAAADVAEAYRAAGWIVRAYLPQQDIVEGRISIQVIEAVLGDIKLEGKAPQRIAASNAISMIEAAQEKGGKLNGDSLGRALLLLNDLPGITATGVLSKGDVQGETDLILQVADDPLVNGDVGIDNTGSYSTGSSRVTANVYVNSPRKLGDQLSTNIIHSSGNDYLRLSYSIPAANNGLRLSVNGSYLRYDIVEGDFNNAGLEGMSSVMGFNVLYPVIRSRLSNLYLSFNYDYKYYDNKAINVTTTRYFIDNFSVTLNGNLFDKLGGGGANSAAVTLTRGNLDLSDQDNRQIISPEMEGHFTKLNYYLSRQQFVTNESSVFVALSGQEASNRLDSAEKFYIGGAYGVRAYPANEGSGSDGQLLNLELRRRLPHNVVLTGFYDLGHVQNTDTLPDSYFLRGTGFSTAWTARFGLNIKATWAHRLGQNPNQTATGKDQDGTLDRNRFWLQATMPF